MAARKAAAAPPAPRTVPTSAGRDARVERLDDGRVQFTWTTDCSVRLFTPESLLMTIDCLELGANYGDDVWFEGADQIGRRFVARIADGKLYASDSMGEDLPHAEWEELREALLSVANPREERGQVMT